MGKWITKYLLFFLFPFAIYAQGYDSKLTKIRSIFEGGNTEKALQESLLAIKTLESPTTKNPVDLFKAYLLIGEIQMSYSDIEEALSHWQKAYEICRGDLNDKPEYLAEVYSCFSNYYNFRMKIDSAYHYADLAIKTYKNKHGLIPVHKVYRTYAIALKAVIDLTDYSLARDMANIYLDSALFFQMRYFPNDKYFQAQLLRDKGNLQTDLVLYFKRQKKPIKEVNSKLASANGYYDHAVKILIENYGNKHPALAETYFAKGLSYSYYNQFDSLITICGLYQKAICSLAPNYGDLSFMSCPSEKTKFLNTTLAITLFRFKLDAMHFLYKQTNDIKLLESIYQQSQTSVSIWQGLFKQLRTKEIQIALETYGASPFGGIIIYANTYYQITKNKGVKNNVFRWINLNKYSAILKDNINDNRNNLSDNIDLNFVQDELSNNQAIIDFYISSGEMVCFVISKSNAILYPNKEISNELEHCDSLLSSLSQHNAKKYCKTAKLLYDSIFQPYTKDIPSNVNHIIISPHNKLSRIPFDALVTNKTSHFNSADFLIKRYNIRYALSSALLFQDNEKRVLPRTMTLINPTYQRYSDLPFSRKVMDDIKSDFEIKNTMIDSQDAPSILHVSAHAVSVQKDSRSSYIVDSDTTKITIDELARNKQNYKLGVLTACETASGEMELGEGIINFSRALFLAGTKSSITTLWKVDDEASSKINRGFYTQLLNGSSAVVSLHESKLEFLKNSKSVDDYDPYYWAGFVYTGQDIFLETKSTFRSALTYTAVAIFLILLVIIIRKFGL